MVARSMTNLTPIQLEEFESVFRHFDRDDTNSLHELEFSAALASLGLVFSEAEMHDYFVDTAGGRDRVTFEQFIRFMVDVTEDQNTAEQVFQSFREVADGKPYVTEMDLRHSLVPDDVIDKLVAIIPRHRGPDMAEDRGLPQFDYIAFMDTLISSADGDAATAECRGCAHPRVPAQDIKQRPTAPAEAAAPLRRQQTASTEETNMASSLARPNRGETPSSLFEHLITLPIWNINRIPLFNTLFLCLGLTWAARANNAWAGWTPSPTDISWCFFCKD